MAGRWTARTVVALSIAALAFEQSPANEAVRANLAFRVLDHTGNAVAVAAAVFAITLVIEGVPGVLIAGGLHLNPSLERRLMRRDADGDAPVERRRRGGVGATVTDVGIALGVGAGLVVVRRRWADPGRTLRTDLRTCAWACVVVAAVSGVIGFLVAGGIRYADAVGLERPAELVVDYATDWRFWLVVVVAIQGGSWITSRLRRSSSTPDSIIDLTDDATASDTIDPTPDRDEAEQPHHNRPRHASGRDPRT